MTAPSIRRGKGSISTLARCRMVDRARVQCTAEAIDPDADILICSRHAAAVMELITTGINARRSA